MNATMTNIARLTCRFLTSPRLSQVRRLSVAETATALRPFYFAVHPDLFGKYPQAREVNEDSLKILNEYLHSLHNEQKVRPVSLLFNVRSTLSNNDKDSSSEDHGMRKSAETFRIVRISLLSDNVRSTVSAILQSCNLPLDYVDSIKIIQKPKYGKPDRPIKWDPSFYTYYNIPNPYAGGFKKRPSFDTLSSWLDRNIGKAKKNQAAKEGMNIEIDRLKKQLLKECGLVDIKWASGWGLTQFRAGLKGFLRIYQESNGSLDLRERSLIFGHENGVCLQGNIVVKTDDLADSWMPFLKLLPTHTAILKDLPAYENVVSHLLNNITIVRRKEYPVILAKEYLHQLMKLSSTLETYFTLENHLVTAGALKDVDVVVECAQGPLHINPAGQVLIPSSCPAFLILDYLNDNAETARQMKKEFQKKNKIVTKLVKRCKEELLLQSLSKDANITCDQLEQFCHKVLYGDIRNIPISLSGCKIRVAQFYSVMSDGEIYIPWNWKGAYDEDSIL